MIEEGVYYDMTDEEYHKQYSREEHYYSSSQLKDILESPEIFKDKYILGNIPEVKPATQDAYDVGTVVHTAILEPDKLKGSYVKWTSGNRTGKPFEDFKKKNKGKLILNKSMLKKANNAIKSVRGSDLCMEYFEEGQAEVSFFVIFMGRRFKVRTDWLGSAYIDDLKTMSGNVKDKNIVNAQIKRFKYDMSAAFYVDMVNYCIDYFELDMPYIKDFYWTFASKDVPNCAQMYNAKKWLSVGRAKYKKAIGLIDKYEKLDWEFPEEIIDVGPGAFEQDEWINKESNDDSDLL